MTSLYTLHNIQISGSTFSAEIRFDPSHPVFAGHFTGQPVVPGVFLVEILAGAVSEVFGKESVVKEAGNLKFIQVIDPTVHHSVLLDGSIVKEEKGILTVDATFSAGDLLFSKMKGVKVSISEF
jgi:3-hydroxyacyl-[acyl-carrier-protein] dehydratase